MEWGSWDGVSLRLLTTRVRLQAAITETHLPKTIVKQVFRKQQQRERERERIEAGRGKYTYPGRLGFKSWSWNSGSGLSEARVPNLDPLSALTSDCVRLTD